MIYEYSAPGRDDGSLCRTVAMRLRKTLAEYGIEYIMTESSAGRCVNKGTFDCDYYLYLQGIREAERAFMGEYMTQYSWAETTLSQLINQTERSDNGHGD